jgi:hypothetical protein
MKSESAAATSRRRAIDPCALMNAPDDCEFGLNTEDANGAS